MQKSPIMARRPEGKKEDLLTREELKELQNRLSHLSTPAVEDFLSQRPPLVFTAAEMATQSALYAGTRAGMEAAAEVARLAGPK
jgi:hypothetical protein